MFLVFSGCLHAAQKGICEFHAGHPPVGILRTTTKMPTQPQKTLPHKAILVLAFCFSN
jgi:hypothetical protein